MGYEFSGLIDLFKKVCGKNILFEIFYFEQKFFQDFIESSNTSIQCRFR